ncbi:MAG: hypothetical protein DKINENOH_02484 [bacterium]|nr:hypothetical protein [bacterium]
MRDEVRSCLARCYHDCAAGVCPKRLQPRLSRDFQDFGRRGNSEDFDATATPLQAHFLESSRIRTDTRSAPLRDAPAAATSWTSPTASRPWQLPERRQRYTNKLHWAAGSSSPSLACLELALNAQRRGCSSTGCSSLRQTPACLPVPCKTTLPVMPGVRPIVPSSRSRRTRPWLWSRSCARKGSSLRKRSSAYVDERSLV